MRHSAFVRFIWIGMLLSSFSSMGILCSQFLAEKAQPSLEQFVETFIQKSSAHKDTSPIPRYPPSLIASIFFNRTLFFTHTSIHFSYPYSFECELFPFHIQKIGKNNIIKHKKYNSLYAALSPFYLKDNDAYTAPEVKKDRLFRILLYIGHQFEQNTLLKTALLATGNKILLWGYSPKEVHLLSTLEYGVRVTTRNRAVTLIEGRNSIGLYLMALRDTYWESEKKITNTEFASLPFDDECKSFILSDWMLTCSGICSLLLLSFWYSNWYERDKLGKTHYF